MWYEGYQFHQTSSKSKWQKAQSHQQILQSFFLANSKNFVWKCFVNWLFLSLVHKICALHEKAARKLLMKLTQGLKPGPYVYFFLLPLSYRKTVMIEVLLEVCGFLKIKFFIVRSISIQSFTDAGSLNEGPMLYYFLWSHAVLFFYLFKF